MMAKGHIAVACEVFAVGSLLVHDLTDLAPLLVGVTVGAIFPDIDNYYSEQQGGGAHAARIIHVMGPVSKELSRGIATVSGGHRQATHSPVGILFEGAVLYMLCLTSPLAAIIVASFLGICFMRGILPYRRVHGFFKGPLAIALGILLGYWLHDMSTLLIVSFVIGNFAHILADFPCGHLPLLWPLSDKRTYVRWFVVDSSTEHAIADVIRLITIPTLVFSIMEHLPAIDALMRSAVHVP